MIPVRLFDSHLKIANPQSQIQMTETQAIRTPSPARVERDRFRAPFALRCGALLIDYVLLAMILALSTIIARLMGGGARIAGGTAEKIGIAPSTVVFTFFGGA